MTKKILGPILILVVFLVQLAGTAVWLGTELDAAKQEAQKWKHAAMDILNGYMKSHDGIITSGTQIYAEEGGDTYLVDGSKVSENNRGKRPRDPITL